MTDSTENFELSQEQIQAIAAGLYQLAVCDGMADSEVALIQEFLQEAGASDLVDRLPDLFFDPATAYRVLESSWLRSVFLRSALMLVQSDGVVTDAEREALDWMCSAFGVDGGYDGLLNAVQGQAL